MIRRNITQGGTDAISSGAGLSATALHQLACSRPRTQMHLAQPPAMALDDPIATSSRNRRSACAYGISTALNFMTARAFLRRLSAAYGWQYVASCILAYGVNQGAGEKLVYSGAKYFMLDTLGLSSANFAIFRLVPPLPTLPTLPSNPTFDSIQFFRISRPTASITWCTSSVPSFP